MKKYIMKISKIKKKQKFYNKKENEKQERNIEQF